MNFSLSRPFASLLLLASCLMYGGCSSNLVLNDDLSTGPIFIPQKVIPAPEPTPEPVPEPVMSVSQQNSQAISALEDLGFEAEESTKGVIVYLPPTIYFEGSKSDIDLSARSKIAEIAKEINKDYLVERKIEVSGHTDSVGDAKINLALSKKRAEAAASELIFSNVSLTRLVTKWFGETRPRRNEFYPDGSLNKENRALNRRVEFVILNPNQL